MVEINQITKRDIRTERIKRVKRGGYSIEIIKEIKHIKDRNK